jgi:hypothetical protein
MTEDERKEAIREITHRNAEVIRATERFVVLQVPAAMAPLVWEWMEDAGYEFAATVGCDSGFSMFRKSR